MSKGIMLITGASRGIGKYLTEYYSKEYTVIGISRNPSWDDKNIIEARCDITDLSDVLELTKFISDNFGVLDILINNAGIASMNHLLLTPDSTVENIIDLNFTSTFRMIREMSRLMFCSKSPRIVNLVSVATPLKLEGEAVYAASKAAVVSLTEIAAKELATYKITVNAVGPSPTMTDLIKSVPQDKLDALVDRQAIKRMCNEFDIANVIDFFINPNSNFVTGQTIYLGGI